MKIILRDNEVVYTNQKGHEGKITLGINDIKNRTFETVDIIVMNIIEHVDNMEDVTISPAMLESKMIARKIEDKIKRDVVLI